MTTTPATLIFTKDQVTNYQDALKQLNVLIQSGEADLKHLENLDKESDRDYLNKLASNPTTPKPRSNSGLILATLFRLNEHKTHKIALLEAIAFGFHCKQNW